MDIKDNSYLSSIHNLLKAQYRRLSDAQYGVTNSNNWLSGIEEFRRERKLSTMLLREYIGIEEAKEFSILNANVALNAHPSIFANYTYRTFAGDEIERHKNFVKAIISGLENESVELNGSEIKNSREFVLRKFYEAFIKETLLITAEDYERVGLDNSDELMFIIDQLIKRKLIKLFSIEIIITTLGIETVEKMNKANQETPDQRRFRVLKTIYDLAEGSPSEMLLYSDIEAKTEIDSTKMTGILQYLDQRNLIHMGGEWAQITSDGIDQVETTRSHPEKPTPYFPANIYNTTFNAPVSGVQQGNNNAQYNQITNNTDFNKAVAEVAELIRSSSMPEDDKEELSRDLQSVNKLALQAPTAQTVERAKSKIEYLKTALQATDIAIKVAPHIPELVNYFESLTKSI